MLHRGERVQTAVEAAGGRSGAGSIDASVTIGSIEGVSRAEVFSAVKQAQAQTLATFRRMQQQGLAA